MTYTFQSNTIKNTSNELIFSNKKRINAWLKNYDYYQFGYDLFKSNSVLFVDITVLINENIRVIGIVEYKGVIYRSDILLGYNHFIESYDVYTVTSDYPGYYDDRIVTATLYYIVFNKLPKVTKSYSADSSIDYIEMHKVQGYVNAMNRLKVSLDKAKIDLSIPLKGPYKLDIVRGKDDLFSVKVGQVNQHLYAVKNIHQFLEAITCGRKYKLGKSNALIKMSDFKDVYSKKIFNALLAIDYECLLDCKSFSPLRNVGTLLEFIPEILIENGYDVIELDTLEFNVINSKDSYTLQCKEPYKSAFTKKNTIAVLAEYDTIRYYRLNEATVMLFENINKEENEFPLKTKQKDLSVLSEITNGKAIFIDEGNILEPDTKELQLYLDMDDNYFVTLAQRYKNDDGSLVNAYDKTNLTHNQKIIDEFIKPYVNDYDTERNVFLMDATKSKVRQFLQYGLEPLKEVCKVFASEDVMRISKAKHISSVTTGVRFENGLLHVDFNEDSIHPEEWSAILSQYKRKKKYFQLKSGEILDLDNNDALNDIVALMDRLDVDEINENGEIEANQYRLLGMEDTFDKTLLLDINRDDTYKHALDNYIKYDPNNYSVPNKFDTLFRDYQKYGYKWLTYMLEQGFNPILADDMGLGKTIQVLALLESQKDYGKAIIIAPATLVYNWKEEIKKFSVDIDAVCVVGSASVRSQLYKENHELYITSYDYMRKDYPLLEDVNFNLVILDEAQYIKNSTTKNAESVKSLKAEHRIALTGTPIENTLAELWSIFDFLMPGYLYSYKSFKRMFERPIVMEKDEQASNDLKHLVTPFILRRVKKDVLNELPDKFEIIHSVEFNEEEKAVYQAQLNSIAAQIQQLDFAQASNKIKVLAMLLRLRQLCCDRRLVFENIEKQSTKVDAAFEIIETVKSEGNKVLLFSSFTSMLDLLAQRAKELGIKYHMLTGSDSKEKRKKTIDTFNNDESTLFLISLKAGGTGLNLTAANTVIHFDPWWNQSATNQASDRAYRIGQKKDVTVYKLVMHDSLEEKIIQLQEQKQALANEFIQNNTGSLTQLSKEEFMNLFN